MRANMEQEDNITRKNKVYLKANKKKGIMKASAGKSLIVEITSQVGIKTEVDMDMEKELGWAKKMKKAYMNMVHSLKMEM